MNIKELRIYVDMLTNIEPKAKVRWNDSRDGIESLPEASAYVHKDKKTGELSLVFLYN